MSSSSILGMRQGSGRGLAFVVAGPSGAGKNSVIEQVMAHLPDLAFSVSYTTRDRRDGEVHGEDYYYVSKDEFTHLIEQGEFVEHVTYHGDQYGTSRGQVECVVSEGKDVILQIEVRGAQSLRKTGIGGCRLVYVFLMPSSFERLGARLRSRGSEDEAEIQGRLKIAEQEIECLPLFDYLVINDDFDTAVDELRSIIVSERLRTLESIT